MNNVFHSTFTNVDPFNHLNFMSLINSVERNDYYNRIVLNTEEKHWQQDAIRSFSFKSSDIDRLYHCNFNSLIYKDDDFEKCDYHLIARLVTGNSSPLYVEFYKRYSTSEMKTKGYIFFTKDVNLFMKTCVIGYEEFKDKWNHFIIPSLNNDGIHISPNITNNERDLINKHKNNKLKYDDHNRHFQFKCFDRLVNFGFLNESLKHIREERVQWISPTNELNHELLQFKSIEKLYHFDTYDDNFTIIARVRDNNWSLPLYVEIFRKDGEERVFFMTDVIFFMELCRDKYENLKYNLIRQSLMDEGITLDVDNYIKVNNKEFMDVRKKFFTNTFNPHSP